LFVEIGLTMANQMNGFYYLRVFISDGIHIF
jgi:hypothetical protein